jgi:tripartite-type tricarboxylate transporter receptor subunit TctC
MKLLRVLLLVSIVGFLSTPTQGQTDVWPSKPIKIITPTPAGVGSDFFARLYAEKLSKILKVAVVVENKPGALSTIGADAVAKSRADGYTLLFSTAGPFTMSPFLLSRLPYNADKDFVPIARAYEGGSFIVANKDFPAKNLRDVIALAKTKPGKFSFASYGPGSTSHVGFELFQDAAGMDLLHVPYKQGALQDVISGQVELGWEPPVSALPFIKLGRIQVIAYTGNKRSTAQPNVPTLSELYPGLEVTTWTGFWAPASISPSIVEKLNAAIALINQSAEMKQAISDAGNDPIGGSPSEMATAIKRDAQVLGNLIKSKNIKLD